MHSTASIMLVDKTVRPVRVQYDPEIAKNNNQTVLFKTVDPDLKKDDFVVVITNTRHGMTVAKVLEVGFAVNFDERYDWIVQKVDKAQFDAVLKTEDAIVGKIQMAQETKLRRDIMANMGVDESEFSGLVSALRPAQTALPTPPEPTYSPVVDRDPSVPGGYTGRLNDSQDDPIPF